jgi:nucleotide-binding universal stress UspA family protein
MTDLREEMYRYRHFMVCLTCTDTDPALIRYAASVARLGSAVEVRFVHLLPAPADPQTAHDHDRVLAQVEAAVRDHFTNVAPEVRVCCDVLKGPWMDRVLSYAAEQEVDAIMLDHAAADPGRLAQARRLAMNAPCSVWLVPAGARPLLKRILVPIDFSETSADALTVAIGMAKMHGGVDVLALHVYFNEARVSYEEYDAVLRGQEEVAYEKFMAPINRQGVNVTPLFEEGANIPHVIERVAQKHGADLVVMATRGRSRSAAILLGSVTEETINHTTLPLLVVKHFGARLNVLQALLDRGFRRRKGLQFD